MFFGSRLNRLATSIRRGISKYSVGSSNPGLVFDFIDNFYQKDKNQTVNFDGAITHARNGNAVMTDGYGPELVTNGGFDSDSDWSKGTGWSISGSKAYHASGANGNITQNIAVEADKAYILEFNILEGSANFLWFAVDGVFTAVDSPQVRGKRSFVFTHGTTESIAVGIRAGSSNAATIDNVSVREMPVLKWAPHNELTYSEDLSQLWTVASGAVKSSTTEIDPNGGNTAALITNLQNVDNARINRNLAITEDSTFGVFLKGTAGETINIEHGTDAQTVTLTSDWKLYTLDVTAPQTTLRIINRAGCTADEVYFAFPHVFRSDLGGMVDNPDRGDSYVPTTSSAEYLARIGHHVYNGSAWVNEGLLAESESRVNLAPYSDFSSGFSDTRTTLTANQAVSPDGTENAAELTENTDTGTHFSRNNITVTASINYTLSVYVKQGSGSRNAILRTNAEGADDYVVFDFTTESITETGSGASNETSQSVGNGWYRIAFTYTQSSNTSSGVTIGLSNSATPGTSLPSYTGDGSSSVYFYGLQFEEGASNTSVYTPSSLIPTSGQQATREAESFTIPSANLPWPEPVYTGSELVTNGNGATTTDWDAQFGNATLSVSSGSLVATADASGAYGVSQQLPSMSTGTVLAITATIDVDNASGGAGNFRIATSANLSAGIKTIATTTGTHTFYFVTDAAGPYYIGLVDTASAAGDSMSFDSISVREINPLSVSIAMDGRVTYADTSSAENLMRWLVDSDNKILYQVSHSGSRTGMVIVSQEESNVADSSTSSTTYLDPNILVPFNVAGRHGSTFVQGAEAGVSFTEDTTPTALVDLSATDLSLAHSYMGTIGTFRVWDKDLGDDGIVEATNPSLEPSLSLTFEGTGTNSFVVNNWSE